MCDVLLSKRNRFPSVFNKGNNFCDCILSCIPRHSKNGSSLKEKNLHRIGTKYFLWESEAFFQMKQTKIDKAVVGLAWLPCLFNPLKTE